MHPARAKSLSKAIMAQQFLWLTGIVFLLIMVFSFAAHADPERWKRQGWKTNFDKSSIRFIEILSGGPPKDGIPSIDNPIFETANTISNIGPQEPVIRVAVGDDVRAYPISVLTWHEIVNDVVGGKPIAVTYCPLCNSALVFERQIADLVLDFGTTGKLRNSDLVMYDRQSETWWQQFTGEAIIGDMQGTKLTMVPVRVENFERFLNAHPDGKVLVPNNPEMRRYGQNPYVTYDSRAMPYPLFIGKLPDDISPMLRVVVIKDGEVPIATTLSHLREQSVVRLGDVELRWESGQNSSLDTAVIAKGRDVGNVVAHAIKADGSRGEEVVYDVTFAFAFRAFHPEAEIVQN